MYRNQFQYCSEINDETSARFKCYDDSKCDPEDKLMDKDRPIIMLGALIGGFFLLDMAALPPPLHPTMQIGGATDG